MENIFKKVLFKYHSNILNKIVKETMWAIEVDKEKGIYKLDSIPFYGAPIATQDEFKARFDEQEGFLTYEKTTTPSDYSIVLVIITEEGYNKETIRQEFKSMNCDSEGLNDAYFSMEIPKTVNYDPIKNKLDGYQIQGIINYAEPCLSQKHQLDLQMNVQ